MLKKSLIWSVFIYGIFILLFGYLGYRQSASLISLYSGLGLGGILIFSSLLMALERAEGAYLALIMTILLTGLFSYRYVATEKPIPAILAVASGGMLLFLLLRITRWRS